MKKKQIIFTAPKTAALLEQDIPNLEPDDVRVKMEYTVVSAGTERDCILGRPNTPQRFPTSLGYCGIGCVDAVGKDVATVREGDRVLVYHGNHATHNIRKEDEIIKVENDAVSSLEAAFAIIAAMSLGGVRKLEIEIGESAMVMGQGILGLFATQFCRLNGAYPVIAVDLNADRRNLALELGADYALDARDADFPVKVKELTRGKGVSACVEVTGVSAALNQALECAAYMGRISLLGCTRVSDTVIDYYRQVHRPGIRLIGAHNFVRPKFESYPHHWTNRDDCLAILDLIAAKRILVSPIITKIASPAEAPALYKSLCEDEDFPIGVVFDWKKL